MRISRVKRGTLIAMLGIGVAATAAGGATVAARGDPAAKAEVIAAFKRLNARPSYRMRFTSQEGTGVVEVIRPDRVYSEVRTRQGTYQFISVGTQSRLRVTKQGQPGGWRCSPNGTRPIFLSAMDQVRRNETPVVRRPDTEIQGTLVHSYADASGRGPVLYVDALTGLPRRLVEVDSQSRGILDFYYYATPFAITLPPCK